MSRSILLFGAARERSTRCANKMLRPFAGTTIFDVYLERLARLQRSGLFARTAVAVAACDAGLWAKACSSGVDVAERNAASVAQGIQPREKELHFLSEFTESHVLFLNACMPFFPTKTILHAVSLFLADEDIISLTPRRAVHDWFYAVDGTSYNNPDPKCLSTQGCPPALRAVHAFNVYPRRRMLREGIRSLLKPRDPFVYTVDLPDGDMLDIDDEKDFAECEREHERRASGDGTENA